MGGLTYPMQCRKYGHGGNRQERGTHNPSPWYVFSTVIQCPAGSKRQKLLKRDECGSDAKPGEGGEDEARKSYFRLAIGSLFNDAGVGIFSLCQVNPLSDQ